MSAEESDFSLFNLRAGRTVWADNSLLTRTVQKRQDKKSETWLAGRLTDSNANMSINKLVDLPLFKRKCGIGRCGVRAAAADFGSSQSEVRSSLTLSTKNPLVKYRVGSNPTTDTTWENSLVVKQRTFNPWTRVRFSVLPPFGPFAQLDRATAFN